MISLKEVENIQKDWGANLVKLGVLMETLRLVKMKPAE
jgi:hypothetical protein